MVSGFGLRVSGLGFRGSKVQGLWFRVQGPVYGAGSRCSLMLGLVAAVDRQHGLRVQGSWSSAKCLGRGARCSLMLGLVAAVDGFGGVAALANVASGHVTSGGGVRSRDLMWPPVTNAPAS